MQTQEEQIQDYYIINCNQEKEVGYTLSIKANNKYVDAFKKIDKNLKDNRKENILTVSAIAIGTGSMIISISCNSMYGLIASVLLITAAILKELQISMAQTDKEDINKKLENQKKIIEGLLSKQDTKEKGEIQTTFHEKINNCIKQIAEIQEIIQNLQYNE